MSMKRIEQVFGCILLAFFLFMAYTARTTLAYWSTGAFKGPGSGFFPFWINLILAGLTLYWLFQVTFRPGQEMTADFIPGRRGRTLVVTVFADMVVFTAVLDYTGFPVAMFLFLLIMVTVLGRQTLRDIIGYAIFSFGVTVFFVVIFGHYLEVAFPKSQIPLFKALGL